MVTRNTAGQHRPADRALVEEQPGALRQDARGIFAGAGDGPRGRAGAGVMRFALVNPDWNFQGSTYFGCQEPHYPLELLFAFDQVRAAGHAALLIDAQSDGLDLATVKDRVSKFAPNFLVIPTAPSYLFWRCPPPELRVPQQWFRELDCGA